MSKIGIGSIQRAFGSLAIIAWATAAVSSAAVMKPSLHTAGWIGTIWGLTVAATASGIYAAARFTRANGRMNRTYLSEMKNAFGKIPDEGPGGSTARNWPGLRQVHPNPGDDPRSDR